MLTSQSESSQKKQDHARPEPQIRRPSHPAQLRKSCNALSVRRPAEFASFFSWLHSRFKGDVEFGAWGAWGERRDLLGDWSSDSEVTVSANRKPKRHPNQVSHLIQPRPSAHRRSKGLLRLRLMRTWKTERCGLLDCIFNGTLCVKP